MVASRKFMFAMQSKNPHPHADVDLHGGGESWLCKTTKPQFAARDDQDI
jgi:hypothetical protein